MLRPVVPSKQLRHLHSRVSKDTATSHHQNNVLFHLFPGEITKKYCFRQFAFAKTFSGH